MPQLIHAKDQTWGGGRRRSSRLGHSQGPSLGILHIERQRDEPRVLAVLDVWEGFRLRVVSDESNERDEHGDNVQGSISHVAKEPDTKKSKQKALPVSHSKATYGHHRGSTSNTKKATADAKFPVLVHNMICEAQGKDPSIMRWEHGGATFTVDPDHPGLPSLLAKYFNHRQHSSFRRQ